MSSGGGASLVTVCVVGNVTQHASDTRQHCEPPPDQKQLLPMPTPCSWSIGTHEITFPSFAHGEPCCHSLLPFAKQREQSYRYKYDRLWNDNTNITETLCTPKQTVADWCRAVRWEAEKSLYSSICRVYSCLLGHDIVTGHVVPDMWKDLSPFIFRIKQIQEESSGFAWTWRWRSCDPQQHCCDNLTSHYICSSVLMVHPPLLNIPSLEHELCTNRSRVPLPSNWMPIAPCFIIHRRSLATLHISSILIEYTLERLWNIEQQLIVL